VAASIEGTPPLFRVQGAVTMDTVEALLQQGRAMFGAGEVTVDFGAVTEVDSAAVSLLLHWAREAGARDQRLRVLNLNSNVKSLAVLYGVTELLPLDQP
jgi:phospholipid transport system transporter-binding protein